MSSDQKGLELKVGFFVFIGLVAIAIMAVQFGRLGQGLSDVYELHVEFTNASGLLKNSDVLLSGAAVGRVAEKPKVNPARIGSVNIRLLIREDMKIPKDSTFSIGSSGLMGDRFVEITPPEGFDAAKFDPSDPAQIYQPGDRIVGIKPGGLDELAKKGEIAMQKLAENLDVLKVTIEKVQTDLLSDINLANLGASFASLKTTTDNISTASAGIEEVIEKAKTAVDTVQEVMVAGKETMASANQTMTTANQAAVDIREAIADVRHAIKTTEGAIKAAERVFVAAQSGSGTIPMLLSNREVADNLNALISNIRRHGVLFYRDSAPKQKPLMVPVRRAKAVSSGD